MFLDALPPAVKARSLVLVFAFANAALYSCALPLWEGFDEPFHYGYVETVAVQSRFPVFGQAKLNEEIRQSLALVPLSHFLSEHVPGTVSFEDYAKLGRDDKLRRRHALDGLPRELRRTQSDFGNYEAQQAPLAYIALAPVDLLLSPFSLGGRILGLRLFGAILSTALLFAGLTKLANLIGLDAPMEPAVLACVFASEMLWATVAHVGNDWLAVPLTLCFLTWLGAAARSNRPRDFIILAVIYAAGLLTKAYFLAFAPMFFGLIVVRAVRARLGWRTAMLVAATPLIVSGPWYARNLLLYGSFSGSQEDIAGIGPARAIGALLEVPWVKGVPNFLRWSLWTGNWSFLSFSQATLNAELALIGFALALYGLHYKKISGAERWVIGGCACLVAGLVYQTSVTWVATKGESIYPEPWYWQGMLPCLWMFAFRGLEESGLAGRICGTLLCLLSFWIAALTYLAKLLPLYAGGFGRSTLGSVAAWWLSQGARQDLDTVALAPSTIVYAMTVAFLALLIAAVTVALRQIWRFSGVPSPPDRAA